MAAKRKFPGKGRTLVNKRPKTITSVAAGTAAAVGQAIWNNKKWIMKNAWKAWKSYTKTKQRKNIIQRPAASGYGQSKHVYTKRAKDPSVARLYKVMSTPCITETIDTGAAISTVARQGTRMVGCWFTGRTGLSPTPDSSLNFQTLFNQAQIYYDSAAASSRYHTGGAYIAGGGQQSFKLYMDSFSHKLALTNQSQVDAKLSIYYCFSKASAADGDTPLGVWTAGYNAQTSGGTAPSVGLDYPDAVPTQSKTFNLRWKIFLRKDVMMPAGYTHEHTEIISFKRIVDMMHAETFNVIRGLTISCFIVWQGQPVDDGTTNKVAIAPIKMIYTSKHKAVCRFLLHTNRNLSQIDNQETALASQKFYEPESGTVGDLLTTDAPA